MNKIRESILCGRLHYSVSIKEKGDDDELGAAMTLGILYAFQYEDRVSFNVNPSLGFVEAEAENIEEIIQVLTIYCKDNDLILAIDVEYVGTE